MSYTNSRDGSLYLFCKSWCDVAVRACTCNNDDVYHAQEAMVLGMFHFEIAADVIRPSKWGFQGKKKALGQWTPSTAKENTENMDTDRRRCGCAGLNKLYSSRA